MAATGIICQGCGIEAPTKYFEFLQNIGAIVMRYRKTYKGNMCKRCAHKYFWKATGITLAIGWLGYISLVLAPIFIVNNIIRYLGALTMPGVPAGAKVPVLDAAAINKLNPLEATIVSRLNGGEPLVAVANDLAPRAGVTPGQVVKYVAALAQSAAPAEPPTGGFPVVPVATRVPPPPIPLAPAANEALAEDEAPIDLDASKTPPPLPPPTSRRGGESSSWV